LVGGLSPFGNRQCLTQKDGPIVRRAYDTFFLIVTFTGALTLFGALANF
jgi:hypothetical protein